MKIETIDEFYRFLKSQTETEDNLIYRGVRNSTFKLVPSIGRLKNKKGNKLSIKDEISLFDIFKHRAYPFIKDYKDDKLELLSIGQHHGLPTRLLDWTKNLLIAIYYAVDEDFTIEDERDTEYCSVYIHQPKKIVKLDDIFNPFKVKEVRRFVPKHWDNRIIAQGSLFTVHHNPWIPWEPKELKTILIHKDIRKQIKKILNKFGIHQATVCPDLDGIASHIKWLRSNQH